ncbi:hypothetical protein H6F90_11965 [Trichocoleus sp. FACHB-591]|uniref:hypothetical protein n=1 Tax=Trichocoleus sp. FACHB-591 TaxID=2692872 RepID=UPI0016865182|nr:hypothetical protein [Trichocoleus sp. FACHB-591]MBD2095865.1 hypothetical protein [Trichocoleus sp. FACHB-591]
MNRSFPPALQQAIQQSLQNIASQMEKPLNEVAAKQLYQEAEALLNHVPHEPLTLARVAGKLLVYQGQETEPEELEWFKSQVQQSSGDEEIEELMESLHRTDAL